MPLSDQIVKLRLVLLTAVFALAGFVLEIGPVGGVFSLVNKHLRIIDALSIEVQTLGFLAYLALPASALVGLHPFEEEPTRKDTPPVAAPLHTAPKGEAAGEQVRVRPELHQLRMLFTALGGYTLLKWLSLTLMMRFDLDPAERLHLFNFGFFFIALAWLMMWQFLRWFAQSRRWERLEVELVGVDISGVVAIIVLLAPLVFFINLFRGAVSAPLSLLITTALLYLTIAAAAALLWRARPSRLPQTIIGLYLCEGVIILLTILLAALELGIAGG